jgi:hypothetical protein
MKKFYFLVDYTDNTATALLLRTKKRQIYVWLMFSMGELTRKGGFGCLLYGVAGREKMVKLM